MDENNELILATTGDRINQIRLTLCAGKNDEFAAKIGKSWQYTSALCNGRKQAGKKMLEEILTAFPEVSRSWLYFGEGDMLVNSGEIRARDVGGDLLGHGATKVSTSSDDVQKLVNAVADLTAVTRQQSNQIDRLLSIIEKQG